MRGRLRVRGCVFVEEDVYPEPMRGCNLYHLYPALRACLLSLLVKLAAAVSISSGIRFRRSGVQIAAAVSILRPESNKL
jgi:hypothetical protein